MGGRYRTQMGSPVYQFAHLRLGFLVCLLPFGVLQPIADSRLMDIGYVRTKDLIQSAEFVHLVFELAVTLVHAVKQSVRNAVLHTVELILIGIIHQINGSVRLTQQLFLVQFLDMLPFLFHLIHFLPLGLFRK